MQYLIGENTETRCKYSLQFLDEHTLFQTALLPCFNFLKKSYIAKWSFIQILNLL